MLVLLVTPTKNAEKFLDETIFSIVSQVGDFDLHYHIQDSQSSDTTIEIVKKWERILSDPGVIFQSISHRPRISFSWICEEDIGMYDAINRGFMHLLSQIDSSPENVVMSWLNGDDTLIPGALQTVVKFFHATDCRWVTGNPSVIRYDSAITDLRDSPLGFSRTFLRKGLYDERHYPCLQQEGTFWRQSLWQEVGGLNARLQLAGDWDLWRRFAAHSDLATLKAVLGFHRRRPGQLSSNMEAYYHEIDTILDRSSVAIYQPSYDDVLGLVGVWNANTSQWETYRQIIAFGQVEERIVLSNELYAKNQEIDHLNHQIGLLQDNLAYVSTTKAAIRKLLTTILKKIKLYNIVYQNYKFFVPIYNYFHGKWKSARSPSKNTKTFT